MLRSEKGEAPVNQNLVSLIALLREPDDPAPIALTPQTPGGVLVVAVPTLLLLLLMRKQLLRWRARAYRRTALRELACAPDDPAAIAAILRRTAMTAYSRTEVASLTGEAWLAFLDRHGDGVTFSTGAGRWLVTAPYSGRLPTENLKPLVAAWIRRHLSR